MRKKYENLNKNKRKSSFKRKESNCKIENIHKLILISMLIKCEEKVSYFEKIPKELATELSHPADPLMYGPDK